MTGKIGIIGAGLMGSGIAQVAATAGYVVAVCDLDDAALKRARTAIEDSLARFVRKERLSRDEADAALDRIAFTTSLEDAAGGAELVVEAVFERLDLKQEVFRAVDAACGDDAVLCTNTSAIPITSIAAVTSRPDRVVGTHFFSPVPMMELCELVRGHLTSDSTLQRARSFAEEVGKTCIVVNSDIAGFVTTRLLVALLGEATRLVEAGIASAQDVDTACRLGFGHRMGPLATMDLTGLDVIRNAALAIHADTQRELFFPPELLSRMVAAGQLGRKTGQGFYRHDG